MQLKEMLDFNGREVLITGAASGIGRATAGRFAETGADLLLLDVNEKGLQKTVANLPRSKARRESFMVDLSSKDAIDRFWDGLQNPPDVLVNVAGAYPTSNFLRLSKDRLGQILDVNMNSSLWMCQKFIARRGERGGVVVNFSSIEALLPFKRDLAPYSMAKAGVIALTRSLTEEYARKGFRFNVILPGAIRTPGTEALAKKAIFGLKFDLFKTGYDFWQRIPDRRWGKPDEVARVAVFLSSDLASYMNGAIVLVDGGFLSN